VDVMNVISVIGRCWAGRLAGKEAFFPRWTSRHFAFFLFWISVDFVDEPNIIQTHPSPRLLAALLSLEPKSVVTDTLAFMSFISVMNEQVFQAAVEYIAGEQEETQATFLRRKGMKTKSHQIYFSLFMSASKPEWQQKVKHAREMGTAIAARTPHQRKVMRLALRIFDMRQEEEEEEKIQKHQEALGKRKTHPPSNEAEGPPDLQALQASVVSMTDAIRSVQCHRKGASKLLAAERQTIRKWKQDKEQLQARLLEYSESLVEERRATKNIKRDNQRRRKQLAQLPSSIQKKRNDRANHSLETENQTLGNELQVTQDRFLQASEKATESLKEERQIHDQKQEEWSQLQSQLDSLTQLYRRTSECLSFQTTLVQKEETRRAKEEAKLQEGWQKRDQQEAWNDHSSTHDAAVSVGSMDDGTGRHELASLS
jgi:hypothetical protein